MCDLALISNDFSHSHDIRISVSINAVFGGFRAARSCQVLLTKSVRAYDIREEGMLLQRSNNFIDSLIFFLLKFRVTIFLKINPQFGHHPEDKLITSNGAAVQSARKDITDKQSNTQRILYTYTDIANTAREPNNNKTHTYTCLNKDHRRNTKNYNEKLRKIMTVFSFHLLFHTSFSEKVKVWRSFPKNRLTLGYIDQYLCRSEQVS